MSTSHGEWIPTANDDTPDDEPSVVRDADGNAIMRGPYVDQRAQELRTLAAKIAADLYQDGKPPTPFDTTMLGYA
ncbi:MAG TPA: hypothetical protein DCR15_09085, partial [Arthrobacter bacterium]|nr:hypothetical protein [Arthrobacter sp.]